ncbi:MAG: nicotinate phosphoribosyltransferase [Caulobacteraceae bacterium]
MDIGSEALLTDLYQLNMAYAYEAGGLDGEAVFEFFVRRLPERRNFLMAAGLEQALDFLEGLAFTAEDLDWLKGCGRFDDGFVDYLTNLRFTGSVHAVPEGTIVFPNEPILRVTAPMAQAQLVETRLINILHFHTLVASKAARMVLAAPGKLLVDFGLRRAHGAEAGLMAARASYLAGFDGTASVLAGRLWGIPLYGTMAHSFIQAHDTEAAAFEAFARARPKGLVLLIDTYDTLAAAREVVRLALKLREAGIEIEGVRIDSGDLISLSRGVRAIFDQGGLQDVTIFASGGLDEDDLARFIRAKAPIDGYGLGTSLTTSSDAPALDCAYKLEEYAGVARRKRSPGKATWPGRKQVWRRYDADGAMTGDLLGLEGGKHDGEPLLHPVMIGGRRLAGPSLAEARAHAAASLARLPVRLRDLEQAAPYPIEIGEDLLRLTEQVDARTAEALR